MQVFHKRVGLHSQQHLQITTFNYNRFKCNCLTTPLSILLELFKQIACRKVDQAAVCNAACAVSQGKPLVIHDRKPLPWLANGHKFMVSHASLQFFHLFSFEYREASERTAPYVQHLSLFLSFISSHPSSAFTIDFKNGLRDPFKQQFWTLVYN